MMLFISIIIIITISMFVGPTRLHESSCAYAWDSCARCALFSQISDL